MKHGVKVRMYSLVKREVCSLFRLRNHFCPGCSPVSIYTELLWFQSKFTYIFLFFNVWIKVRKRKHNVRCLSAVDGIIAFSSEIHTKHINSVART